MSVRSFSRFVGIAFTAFALWVVAAPVHANSCSFACTASFIAPGAPGSGSTCTSDTECARYCATTCGALRSPAAFVDSAHPSTCSGATASRPGACTACSCTPNIPLTCEGTTATTCASSCATTCSGYNSARPSGVGSISCATGDAAPRCVPTPPAPAPAPAPAPGGATGHCRYACSFGVTARIRTTTDCTPGPSACSASALASQCTSAGLTPTATAECVNGAGGNKCVITCDRPTAVSPTDLGTCPLSSTAPGDADICPTRCQEVCGRRGMTCATGATCAAGGHCAFTCQVATTATVQDDQAERCDATQSAAAVQQCSSRCQAYCGEHGGLCADDPAPSCATASSGSSDGASNNTTGDSNGGSAPARPPQTSRTAPMFRVTFPDPFGGNMTLTQVIGNIVRVLVGFCGVFFLAVFIYGGVQYLTSAGNSSAVQKGQQAIVNAVIGLVVVLFAYLGVSLVIQISDQFQTGQIAPPDLSQNAQDDGGLQPGGTTRATGRSSQDPAAPGTPSGGTTAPAQAGSPAAACRSYYGADPATCSGGGGGCPVGVNDMTGLISAWGRSFPPASSDIPDPAAACRTCLDTGIRGLQGRYPGLVNTCVPALVNLWSTTCHDTCNPRSPESSMPVTTGSDICNTANYNTSNAGCGRCIAYWSNPARASTIAEVGCPTTAGKVVIWCAGAESPSRTSRPESGGYCTFTLPRR